MMNVSKKKHTTLWWVLGLGLVFIPAWLLCFYLASLAIYDLFVDTLVVALALGIVSYLLSKVLHVATPQEALVTGCVWAFLLLLVELLITLLNGTTGVIFGIWATYVVFVAIALAPRLAFLATRPRVHRQETVQ
jgi:hypothetical protein